MASWLTSWISSLFCLGLLSQLEASHFRGGVITWRPTGTPNQIDIQYRLSWRRSSGYPCTDSSIRDPMLIGSGSLRCNQCSYAHICDLKFYCTDYSVPEDWTTGVNTFTYDVERPIFDMRFYSCCWITIQNGGGSVDWSIEAHVDLTPRADNGLINSSPVTAMTPILRAQYGCSYTINIPTSDPDNDDVRCRWPSNYYEKGDMYLPPMNMVLSQDCTITYQATGTGWWGVAVILEDFISSSSMDPLSKIPLQFLIHVTHGSGSCSSKPTFVDPTPNDGSSRDVFYGELFRTVLRTRSSSQSVPVTNIDTISPQGMTKSSLQQVFNSPTEFFVTVEWTPLAWQRGPNIFCFTAIDLNGYTSDQRCMTLHVWEPEVTTVEDVTLDITAMSTTIDITDQATTVESTTVNEVTTSVDCDSVLTSAPGTVSSPNYPGNYPNHATCNTLITASNGLKVVVTFKTFRLENCCDYLSIYDGDGPEDRLIGRFLGTDLPPGTSITSTGADLLMVFTTDYSVTYSGYEADYRFACDSVWLSAPGIISSPNYPGNYPNSVTCNTRITASNGQRVVIAFRAFNLESGYDYLRIYDGDGPEDRFIGSYSGTNMPPPITSSGKDLFLVFTTDGSVIRSGYEAEYNFENDMITTDLTTIMITKESTTEDLATTESAEGTTTEGIRTTDITTIWTTTESTTKDIASTAEGTTTEEEIRTTEGHTTIVERSTAAESTTVEKTTTANCDAVLTSAPGTVTSPNYPGKYPNRVTCNILIIADDRQKVVLTFKSFYLESCCDFLSIYDGDGPEDRLIGRFTGTSTPYPITSTGRDLLMIFTTDGSVTHSGFEAKYRFEYEIRTTDLPILTTTKATTTDAVTTDESTTAEETTISAREPTTFEPLTTVVRPTDNPASSVICADNTMNVYIPRSIIGDVDADHLHFIDKACVGTSHNATHVRVTTSFDQCGTVMEVRGDYVVFANIVIDDALPVTPGNEITRERDLEIPVECRMERDGFGSINFNPDSSKIVIEEEGYGKFSFELHLYPDNTYNSPFPPEAYPVNVKLRDMLHFESQVVAETGLELFVETCAATTTTNPYSSPQYRFLDDGCIQDNTLQFYPSSDPMIQRFGLEAFAFVDSKTPVYVHCFLMVCNTTNPTSRCALGCQPSISKRDVSSHEGSKSYVMTEGPLRFLKEHKTQAFDNLDDNTSDIASVQQLGLFIASAVFMTLCFTVMIGVIIRSRRNPVPKGYTLLTNKHE